jgi:hypothetical protein
LLVSVLANGGHHGPCAGLLRLVVQQISKVGSFFSLLLSPPAVLVLGILVVLDLLLAEELVVSVGRRFPSLEALLSPYPSTPSNQWRTLQKILFWKIKLYEQQDRSSSIFRNVYNYIDLSTKHSSSSNILLVQAQLLLFFVALHLLVVLVH